MDEKHRNVREMGSNSGNISLWKDFFKRRKSDREDMARVLKNTALFSGLSPLELKTLAQSVYQRVYEPGETIFHQNHRGFGMYVIARGSVAIRGRGRDGEYLITTLREGSFFGELALVEPENIRTASAVAQERSILIGFFKPDLQEILERKPSMGVKILYQLSAVLGRRLIETTERVSEIISKGETRADQAA